MNRSLGVIVIAVLLAAYGFYGGSFVPAMLVVPAAPVLLVGYVLQTIAAFVAATGVWMKRPWATTALVVLGAFVSATWLVEGFALGIVAYFDALAVAVLAMVLCIVGAAYVGQRRALL